MKWDMRGIPLGIWEPISFLLRDMVHSSMLACLYTVRRPWIFILLSSYTASSEYLVSSPSEWMCYHIFEATGGEPSLIQVVWRTINIREGIATILFGMVIAEGMWLLLHRKFCRNWLLLQLYWHSEYGLFGGKIGKLGVCYSLPYFPVESQGLSSL